MAPPLSDLERLTIRAALEDLNTAFCHHLDHDDVDALLELFTDDVHYTHGARVSRGTSVCMTFGAYGEPPLSPAIHPPHLRRARQPGTDRPKEMTRLPRLVP
ncbi:MAG TPA: nuclear transport factor 2 family protein [Gammaproteobacteria bacterium]|nr:nuclear transport factor 2 family protein [Gammaproteobacteria bacterium]